MSLSPDFIPVDRVGNKCVWVLSGSTEGVPRPDKKVKRATEAEKLAQEKARHQPREETAKVDPAPVDESTREVHVNMQTSVEYVSFFVLSLTSI